MVLPRAVLIGLLALAGSAATAGVWVQADATPRPRFFGGVAYDTGRGRVVLFGGTNDYGDLYGDAWEYNGSTWKRLPAPPAGLTARYGHAMAYDAARSRIVLFGGADAASRRNDTWEYDGTAWTLGPSAPAGLTGRVGMVIAHDIARNRTVLFGGYDGAYRNDTWEYDGTGWSAGPSAPAGLVGRAFPAMAYDSARGRAVLFGGESATSSLDDTWEYDGASWVFTGNGPAAMSRRMGHGMAYDAARARTVLFGGTLYFGHLNDTWEYTGAGWAPGGGTPAELYARSAHALAHDTARGNTVLYGGMATSIVVDDTWTFDGTRWSKGPTSPPALGYRSAHAMVYDASRGRVVLFGGGGPSGLENDTWEFDGVAWAAGPAAPPTLTPRVDHAMVYDANRSRVVLFGGQDATSYLNDTWEYDGTTWSSGPLAPATLYPRREHAMAYDAARRLTVLFGGYSGSYEYDTWEYDGASWAAGPPVPPGLTARFSHAMAFDPASGHVVLHGGYDLSGPRNDTWEYDGSAWMAQASAPTDLTPRGNHAMTLDGTLGKILLFGGDEAFGGTDVNDTWLYTACPAIAIAPASLPDARAGAAYSQTLTATGGNAPYAFAVTSGALPAGLTLSPAGVLAGTPSSSGTATFTVTATDSIGCTGSNAYTMTVLDRMDYLVGQGLGAPNPNRCRVYTASGSGPFIDFYAYGAGKYGLNIAAGNVNGGADDEILTGPGPGDVFGPQVRGFKRDGLAIAKINFYAYGTLKYGVNAGASGIDGDAFAEIMTGPGPGAVFGPHVRAFNFDGQGLTAIAKVSYFAYATLKYGVNVQAGDVDGDAFAEILTGPGPGVVFGPVVRAFNYDGASVSSIAKINFSAFATPGYGALVAGGDVDDDGFSEIAAAPGPGPALPAEFRGFNFDATAISSLPGYDVTGFPGAVAGGRVGLGFLSGDRRADLVGGAGPDPSNDSTVKSWSYTGSSLDPMPATFVAFPGTTFGVNVAAGGFDY